MATLDTMNRRIQTWADAPVDGDWGPISARAVLRKVGLDRDSAPGTLGARVLEPKWMPEARSLIGTAEIPGPRHNPSILGWVRSLGGWFTDDETPWCGTFVAHCVQAAELPFPKDWYRAKAWADWGQPTTPQVGAVLVFGRVSGGHVGFAVGEDAATFSVLGGNQGNRVSIVRIGKNRLLACRWPAGVPQLGLKLSAATGARSENEA